MAITPALTISGTFTVSFSWTLSSILARTFASAQNSFMEETTIAVSSRLTAPALRAVIDASASGQA
jgi:hypothetical protein